NGVLAGSHTTDLSVPETDPVSASASFVGCRGGGKWFCNGSFFTGRMDEVAWFDRPLNAIEIADLHAQGTGWYKGSNEICGYGVADDDCDGANDEPGSPGCTLFYADGDVDGAGSWGLLEFNPVAYWPMDLLDATGQIDDATGNGFALDRRAGRRVLGQVGLAWDTAGWDPMSDLRTLTPLQGSRLDLTEAVSVSAWINARSHNLLADGSTIVGRAGVWDFGVTVDGRLRLEVGSSTAVTAPGSVPTALWVHVAVAYDEVSARFYVNGSLIQTVPMTAALVSSSGDLALGRTPAFATFDRRFDGTIDEVAIFGRALPSATFSTIFAMAPSHACLCAASGAFTALVGGDCNDADPAIKPGAAELCDSVDNDCDRALDEITPSACAPASPASSCVEGVQQCVSNAIVCSDRPRGHFALDEGTGNIGHNSTREGHSLHGVGLSWAAGKVGSSADLGAGDSLSARWTSGSTGAVAFWLRPGSNPHAIDSALFQLTDTAGVAEGTDALWFGLESDQLLVKRGGDQLALPVEPHLPVAVWTHVGLAWEPFGGDTLASVYIDGRRIQSTVLTGQAIKTYGMFGPGDVGGALGRIDDVVIYGFVPRATLFSMLASTGVPAAQDNREQCDNSDNDCDGSVDEPSDTWPVVSGTPVVGVACESGDADQCTEGAFACDASGVSMGCADGPIGWFDFDIAGTVAFDAGGDTGDGTFSGASAIVAGGKTGTAMSAAGGMTHASGSLSPRYGSATMWIKPSYDPGSFSGAKQILTSGAAGSRILISHRTPTVLWVAGGSSVFEMDPTGWFAQDTWAHLAFTWDQDLDAMHVYVDGVLKASRGAWSWGAVSATAGAQVTIGATFQGLIDQYGLYRRALTPTEVAGLFAGAPATAQRNREACDAADNDCDATADEDYPLGAVCDAADADLCTEGVRVCTTLFEAGCPDDGPTAFWPMDVTVTDELLDLSGARLHASMVASPASAAGKFGGALSLDGVSAAARMPPHTPLNMTGTEQTLTAWINPDSTALGMIMHKGDHYGLRRNTNGSISYTNNAEGYCIGCNPGVGFVAPGNWTHVAVVWNGATADTYVNGTLVGSRALVGTLAARGSVGHIGCFA
ncbi:MAG: hypothetical protein ACI9WU_005211, partial [Myxococcota bacterium]